jgi:hypothetical protein
MTLFQCRGCNMTIDITNVREPYGKVDRSHKNCNGVHVWSKNNPPEPLAQRAA